jgi:exopolysaccharide production protein ExoQ
MDESRKISYMNDRRAFLFVVLSVLILAHGSIIGPIGILAFYAMWLPQIQRRGVPVLKINRYNILPFAFLFWCLLSVLWSAYPPRPWHAPHT